MNEGSGGRVFWITGLPGSGKTTLAEALCSALRDRGINPVLLDGDSIREVLGEIESSYDPRGRQRLSFLYGRVCSMLAKQAHTVVCSTVSMFDVVRKWNRENLPGYFEVYLKVDHKVLMERHPKDLYRKAQKGELQYVHGVGMDFEEPKQPDMVFHDSQLDLRQAVAKILETAAT